MFFRLVLCFTLIPILELILLVKLGNWIGLWPTLAIALGTGFAGAWLARQQGLAVMLRIQESMAQGLTPTDELLDGLLIFAAGVVLITPGLITDLAGLTLLIPWPRRQLKDWLRKKFADQASRNRVVIDITPR